MSGPGQLKAGDTIEVWWGAQKRATVIGFRPHDSGNPGWFVADFSDGFRMTFTPESVFTLVEVAHG